MARYKHFSLIQILFIGLLFFIFLPSSLFAIERRQDQSPRDLSYAIIPYAMRMPGIGSFVGMAGTIDNMFGTEADTYLATMSGDLQGYTGGIFDAPIFTENLTAHWYYTNFSKAAVDSFGRGMNSKKEDMQRLFVDKVKVNAYMLNLKFWEKRIQLYTAIVKYQVHPTKILDIEGNLVADISTEEYQSKSNLQGFILDYTDDRLDPREGFRVESMRAQNPPDNGFAPDFYRIDTTSTLYLSMGKQSTWAFNHFRSDAHVTKEGLTDRAAIAARIGIDCAPIPDPVQKATCEASLNTQINQAEAANKYGTAAGLGGVSFLRAYPQNRFYAAHTRFYGTEFRWNFTEGSEPFDFLIMKGIRTILQATAFYERGTVADVESDLGNQWANATGVGFRLLMSSGFVFRFDVGTGSEGMQTTLFFNYPWGLFN